MATLTNQLLKENKVNNKFQMVVMHEGSECQILNITSKNIMMQAIQRLGRGNCGRFNTGRTRVVNNENSTEWYLKNRIIQ